MAYLALVIFVYVLIECLISPIWKGRRDQIRIMQVLFANVFIVSVLAAYFAALSISKNEQLSGIEGVVLIACGIVFHQIIWILRRRKVIGKDEYASW